MHKLIHLHKVKNLYKARISSFTARTTGYPSHTLTHKILSRDFKKIKPLTQYYFCHVQWCGVFNSFFSLLLQFFTWKEKQNWSRKLHSCFFGHQDNTYGVYDGTVFCCVSTVLGLCCFRAILRAPKFHGGIIDNCGGISR